MSPAEQQPKPSVDEPAAIRAEQLRQLFRNTPVAIFTSVVLAALLAMVQWPVVDATQTLAWLILIESVLALRFLLYLAWRRSPQVIGSAGWLNSNRFGVVITGILWGVASVLLFPAHDVPHQATLAFALAGVTAGAVVTYSIDLVSAIGFIVPLALPLIFRLFAEGGDIAPTMGTMVVLFVAFIAVSSRYLYRSLRENISLRIGAVTREDELRIAAAAFDLQEGIIITDADNRIMRVNRAFVELTGYSAEEAVGNTPAMLKSGRHSAEFFQEMWQTLNRDHYWRGEVWNRRKNGEIYPAWLTVTALVDDQGKVENYLSALYDFSQHKQAEEAIHSLAFYDPLTNLPNRRKLLDLLQHSLTASARHHDFGALLFIDLDRFKELNDTRGHNVGDLLLVEVAQRLLGCVRGVDTVARFGGDEFVVILDSLGAQVETAAANAKAAGEKILLALSQPYDLNGYEHHSTSSIGVCLFKNHGDQMEELLKRADTAMYDAKSAGRNTLRFFDPAMQFALEQRIEMEALLRNALTHEQFELYYHPQVDAARQVVGAEALLRWHHPQQGLVRSIQFIPLAEETGLIIQIGHWVLETACSQLKSWEQDERTHDLVLAVNISPRQFRQPDFVGQIHKILAQTGANPGRLKLELTESVMRDNLQDAIEKMTELQKIGVCFSMDDFGIGYSSLAYIKLLPLSQVKIDQSFVNNVPEDINDAAIVRTIIGMAGTLGLDVIAEGVETESQLEFLKQNGCLIFQGYLFSRPLPLAEFKQQLH